MKELFPLNTFQQDAVLKRLNDLLEGIEDVDDKMPYDEDTDTFSLDGDLAIDGDLEVTGDVSASSYGGFGAINEGKALVVNSNGVAVPQSVPGISHLYYHGLDLYKAGVNSATATVLNNSLTPINSMTDFCTWAESITGEVKIALNGACIINSSSVDIYLLKKRSNNSYSLYYRNAGGTVSAYSSIDIADSTELLDYFDQCEDSVNTLL